MMSDNLSHDVDVTEPFEWENFEEWDKQRILTAGSILAQTLELDVNDIFLTCMIALSEAKAYRLVKNLEHTKSKYDNFMQELEEMQDIEDAMSEVVDEERF